MKLPKAQGRQMKILKTNVTKLLLTELDRLDPVGVILEDFGPGQGKITIDCFGKSWTAYWPAMGPQTTVEFVCGCDCHYLANCFLPGIRDHIIDYGEISDEIGNEVDITTMAYFDKELTDAYGGDWRLDLPTKTDPECTYLCRIVDAVKEALESERVDLMTPPVRQS